MNSTARQDCPLWERNVVSHLIALVGDETIRYLDAHVVHDEPRATFVAFTDARSIRIAVDFTSQGNKRSHEITSDVLSRSLVKSIRLRSIDLTLRTSGCALLLARTERAHSKSAYVHPLFSLGSRASLSPGLLPRCVGCDCALIRRLESCPGGTWLRACVDWPSTPTARAVIGVEGGSAALRSASAHRGRRSPTVGTVPVHERWRCRCSGRS